MRTITRAVLGALGGVILFVSGCAFPTQQVPAAALYANVRYPSWYQGVNPTGPGPKRGMATASSILGLVATGDASVAAAARAGGITKIATVDQEYTMYLLGLYWDWTTIVTGE